MRALFYTIFLLVITGCSYSSAQQKALDEAQLLMEDDPAAALSKLDDSPPISSNIDKRIRAHSHLASLYYENTFAEKYLLHFDGYFRRSNENNS